MHGLEGLRLAGDLGLDAGVALSSMATLHAYRGEEARVPSPGSAWRWRSARPGS